ncbi:hypothetical protein [Mycobacterium sp. PS03-16]|nr:hypothetical protein [Mycobacterium sp. PS03-16]
MRHSQCENPSRPPATGDMVRRIVDYATGYADAQADHGADDEGV